MNSTPSLAHYACHRLIDEYGNLHSSSVVTLDKNTHFVVKYTPFDHTESPFIRWTGGIIILGQHPDTHPLYPGDTLSHYIQERATTPSPHTTTLVAWHTPLTDITSPLPTPLVRIEKAFH